MFKKIISIVLFNFYCAISFAESQYLEAPPGDVAKNADVSKYVGLSNWVIGTFVAISVIICGVQAGTYVRQNEYVKAAGPIGGAVLIVIASAWALSGR